MKEAIDGWGRVMLGALGAVLVAWVAYAYLLPVLLPFLIAWAAALATRPWADRLHKKTGISVRALRVSVLLSFLALFVCAIAFFISRLIGETVELFAGLRADSAPLEALFEKTEKFLRSVTAPFADGGDLVGDRLLGFFGEAISGALAFLGALVTKAAVSLPELLFGIVITVVSAVYFALDLAVVEESVRAFLPPRVYRYAVRLAVLFRKTVLSYLKAYLLLAGLTFLMLFVGFLMLAVPYAALTALCLTLFDLLPILGAGILLVPLGLVLLLTEHSLRGIGFILLGTVVLLVRQAIEPRIIGKRLGLHPIPALFFTYAGYRLMGMMGMVLLPIGAVIVRSLVGEEAGEKPEKPRKGD